LSLTTIWLDDARQANEYIPALQYRAIVYYLSEPDLSERTSTLAFGFRLVERYDNRRKEVGFELNYNMAVSSITGTASTTTAVFSGMNFTLLFLHAWNLIGLEENYNQIRNTITLGVGGTYASGFLGALIRANYEWRLAKHWAVTGVLGYRPKATTLTSGTLTELSGIEYGLGVSALF
jgi:hypothetical protein